MLESPFPLETKKSGEILKFRNLYSKILNLQILFHKNCNFQTEVHLCNAFANCNDFGRPIEEILPFTMIVNNTTLFVSIPKLHGVVT